MKKEIKTLPHTTSVQGLFKKIVTYAKKKNLHLYLVGGFLRDYFLKIPNSDLDFVISLQAEKFAQFLAKKLKASFVRLDEKNKIYRVVWENNKKIYNLDFSQMQGENIRDDLSRRDFTINAMALPIINLSTYQLINLSNIIDPYNGMRDLKNRTIRKISDDIFEDDPLRLLRAFRFRANLKFKIDSLTLKILRKKARWINLSAKERIRDELNRIFATDNSVRIIEEMNRAGILKYVFPEIESMKKSARRFYFHPQGLWQHSMESLRAYEETLGNPRKFFSRYQNQIQSHLSEKIGVTERKVLLKFIILFHDVAKPETARREGKRMRFFGHEEKGAKTVGKILKRLRFSRGETKIAEKIITNHMRPGSLTQTQKVTDRAIYRYFHDLGKEGIDLLILSLADRYSYLRISKEPKEIKKHHQRTLEILHRYYGEKEKVIPPKLLNGYEVMKICRIPPGPKVGELLDKIEEAQAEGRIKTKEEAKKFLLNLSHNSETPEDFGDSPSLLRRERKSHTAKIA